MITVDCWFVVSEDTTVFDLNVLYNVRTDTLYTVLVLYLCTRLCRYKFNTNTKLQYKKTMSRLSQSNNKPISESIKVFIRPREFTSSSCIKSCSDNKSCVYYNVTNKTEQRFVFDYFFDSSASQEELYNTTARPIVCSALLGYSGTILAYGPTSSGKTFTMRGGDDSSRGIIPR
jgi:hypothetical protein